MVDKMGLTNYQSKCYNNAVYGNGIQKCVMQDWLMMIFLENQSPLHLVHSASGEETETCHFCCFKQSPFFKLYFYSCTYYQLAFQVCLVCSSASLVLYFFSNEMYIILPYGSIVVSMLVLLLYLYKFNSFVDYVFKKLVKWNIFFEWPFYLNIYYINMFIRLPIII